MAFACLRVDWHHVRRASAGRLLIGRFCIRRQRWKLKDMMTAGNSDNTASTLFQMTRIYSVVKSSVNAAHCCRVQCSRRYLATLSKFFGCSTDAWLSRARLHGNRRQWIHSAGDENSRRGRGECFGFELFVSGCLIDNSEWNITATAFGGGGYSQSYVANDRH